jgi:hypothetical protein
VQISAVFISEIIADHALRGRHPPCSIDRLIDGRARRGLGFFDPHAALARQTERMVMMLGFLSTQTVKFGLVIFLTTLLLRCVAFYAPVINWDETVYALVGNAWDHGNPPYTAIWDNKPPFLYALFAIFEKIIPDPVIAIRLLGVLAASTAAILVGEVAKLRGASSHAAFFASLAFALGSICNGGLATNAELLMVVSTTGAMLAAFTEHPFYAGLSFGAAVFIKHVAAFEIFALLYGLFLTRPPFFKTFLQLALGGLVVPLALIAYLGWSGALYGFWQDVVVDDLTRVSGHFDWAALKVTASYQVCWIMLYASLFLLRDRVIWLWLLGGVIGIISGKYFYPHYFTQILPALCITFALGLDRMFTQRKAAILYALAFLAPTLASGLYKLSLLLRGPHDERAIAARIPNGASLYVFSGEPVLYLLTGATPPTPYVLPTVLTGKLFYGVAQIDPRHEINRIFQNRPDFVVTGSGSIAVAAQPGSDDNPAAYQLAQSWLQADYAVFALFPDAVIWKHR